MRITQNSITRMYLANMNNTLSNVSNSAEKLESGRKYNKISQDVSSGITALKTRQKLYKSEQLQENIGVADEELKVTETNLMSVKEIADTVHEQAIKLQNGTNQTERETFAVQFDLYREQILELGNCTYNDKYVLGGINNSLTAPFTVNDSGAVCYNGVEVDSISKNNGIFETAGGQVPDSEDVYMDIGLGVSFIGSELNTKTAFKVSVSGLDCLGYGTSSVEYTGSDGVSKEYEVPNNLCSLLKGMSDAIRNGDMDTFGAYEVKFKESTDNLVTNISEIGVRTNFLESNLSRLENENALLKEKQSNLEGVEDTEELINYKSFEYAWMLTLQYGSKVIPQSLMDFVK